MPERTCSIEGCERPTNRTYPLDDLCAMHLQRLRLYGDAGEAGARKNGPRGGKYGERQPQPTDLVPKARLGPQRAEDLVAWVVEHYPDEVRKAMS